VFVVAIGKDAVFCRHRITMKTAYIKDCKKYRQLHVNYDILYKNKEEMENSKNYKR